MVNKKLEIREEMKKIEMNHFKDVYPIGIEVDWMSIGGRIPRNGKNLSLINKFTSGGVKGKNPEFVNMRILKDKDLGKIMIKEIRSDILPIVR